MSLSLIHQNVVILLDCTWVLPWYWGYWEYTNMMQIIPFNLNETKFDINADSY